MGTRMATQSRHSTLLRTVLACLLFAAFLQILVVRQLQTAAVEADFRAFYTAGYLLRTAPAHLYDFNVQKALQDRLVSPARYSLPYYHLPYEALLYEPLSRLPYWSAYRCALLLNSVLLLAVLLAVPELQTHRYPVRRLPGLALFLCVPVVIALVQGQDSIVFLLLCSLAWRAWRGERDALCGCLLGLALFRFQLVLPLVALLWWHRRSRGLLLGFASAAAAVLALSWAMVGTAGLRGMAALLSASSLTHGDGTALQDAMGVHPLGMPNLFGLLYRMGLAHLPGRLPAVVTSAVSLAVFLYAAHRIARVRRENAAFALALLCSLLVSLHLSLHDLSLLPLALALLRTRAAVLVGVATYLLAMVTLWLGANTFYLLAVPVLSLVLLRPGPAWSAGLTPFPNPFFAPEPEQYFR